jgi:hypothetical protein
LKLPPFDPEKVTEVPEAIDTDELGLVIEAVCPNNLPAERPAKANTKR